MEEEGTTLPPATLPVATRYVDPFILVCSSASAVSARLVAHPLDTYRIRIQTWPGKVVPGFRTLIPKPRLRTLYAGLPVAIGFSVPALSIYLTTYEASKRFLGQQFLSQDEDASLLQQIPVFVMKARLQKGNEGTTSAVTLMRKIWAEEGYKGVFRGYWMSMAIFIPSVSFYWFLYESFKTRFIPGYSAYRSTTPPPPITDGLPLTARFTLCSVSACALAAMVTNPFEVVQSRWQTSAGKEKGGIKEIVRGVYRQGGVLAFTKGMSVRMAYAIPANGVSMTVYEALKQWKGI
ncbi:mitochondrial carrier protein [Pseudohyphozyma bogoriensis]|nr:mitochondrial carrier protein [Pseudohyphozyma bogoriensis]